MDELKRMGVTDDLANQVLASSRREQHLKRWLEHYSDRSVALRKTEETQCNPATYDPMTSEEKAAIAIAFVAVLILIDWVF